MNTKRKDLEKEILAALKIADEKLIEYTRIDFSTSRNRRLATSFLKKVNDYCCNLSETHTDISHSITFSKEFQEHDLSLVFKKEEKDDLLEALQYEPSLFFLIEFLIEDILKKKQTKVT